MDDRLTGQTEWVTLSCGMTTFRTWDGCVLLVLESFSADVLVTVIRLEMTTKFQFLKFEISKQQWNFANRISQLQNQQQNKKFIFWNTHCYLVTLVNLLGLIFRTVINAEIIGPSLTLHRIHEYCPNLLQERPAKWTWLILYLVYSWKNIHLVSLHTEKILIIKRNLWKFPQNFGKKM